MRQNIKNMLIAYVAALSSVYMLPVASDEVPTFNLTQVADGVYVHSGLHVPLTHPQHDDIANIGFIVGEQCIAVIDAGGSVAIGGMLRAAIRRISDRPICYVINTHVHFDHVLGNFAFLEDKPRFVGHHKLASMIEQSREFFLQNFSQNLAPLLGKDSIIAPDLGVEDTMTLDLGNRTLKLIAYPPAHTYGDLSVTDTKTHTLWTGDLISRERIPVLDGKLQGWIVALEALRNQTVRFVIPGHGDIGSDFKQALSPTQTYLNMLLTDTQTALDKGWFLEDAIDTIGAKKKQQWLLHEHHHRANVSKAFTELEWQ